MKGVKKISEDVYEVSQEEGMNVPGKLFVSEKIFKDIDLQSIKQVKEVAKLPGILNYSIGLSDMHVGYGFPIGGVAGFDASKSGLGVITPGGIGFDINCSVRLLRTNLTKKDLDKNKKKIADELDRRIPSGLGRGSPFQVSKKEFKKILERGAKYLIEKGYGKKQDYLHIEEEGCMREADSEKVSDKAIKRGLGQLGTLGSGNHFLDVQVVDEVVYRYRKHRSSWLERVRFRTRTARYRPQVIWKNYEGWRRWIGVPFGVVLDTGKLFYELVDSYKK